MEGGRSEKAEKTFLLLYMQKFRPKWLPSGEEKEEKVSAAMFVLFFPSTRIFRAKVVYMVLGFSYLPARKFLSLGKS